MDIYLVVPAESLKNSETLIDKCRSSFSRQKEKLRIHSSLDEGCTKLAREIALSLEISMKDDASYEEGEESVAVFIMPMACAETFARAMDASCLFIPRDTLFQVSKRPS